MKAKPASNIAAATKSGALSTTTGGRNFGADAEISLMILKMQRF
jgi:hypothetical protein